MAGLLSSWYWKNFVGRLLGSLLPGGRVSNASPLVVPNYDDPAGLLDSLTCAYHYSALASPSLWIGAAVGIGMIAGAIWFRRWRDDS